VQPEFTSKRPLCLIKVPCRARTLFRVECATFCPGLLPSSMTDSEPVVQSCQGGLTLLRDRADGIATASNDPELEKLTRAEI